MAPFCCLENMQHSVFIKVLTYLCVGSIVVACMMAQCLILDKMTGSWL